MFIYGVKGDLYIKQFAVEFIVFDHLYSLKFKRAFQKKKRFEQRAICRIEFVMHSLL